MRLWSIHPKYLDTKGLLGLWRESLHARKVLQGRTKGYRHHPQLIRFKKQDNPIKAINSYLCFVLNEGIKRGYRFNTRKVCSSSGNKRSKISKISKMPLNRGQLLYEFNHLKKKLRKRDTKRYSALLKIKNPLPNPMFRLRKGPVEGWERVK